MSKLPDCMMPDGGDACIGYQDAIKRIAELEAELASLKDENTRLNIIKEFMVRTPVSSLNEYVTTVQKQDWRIIVLEAELEAAPQKERERLAELSLTRKDTIAGSHLTHDEILAGKLL